MTRSAEVDAKFIQGLVIGLIGGFLIGYFTVVIARILSLMGV
jgi:hypothetical protein